MRQYRFSFIAPDGIDWEVTVLAVTKGLAANLATNAFRDEFDIPSNVAIESMYVACEMA